MRQKRVPRRWLLAAGAGTTLGLTGCLTTGSGDRDPIELADDFEDGLAAWEADSDVPDDPNRPGNPVEWEITRSTERAASGTASARYYLDGRQDDGTIWIVRPVALAAGQAFDVTMHAEAWSASESFNTLAHLVMYAGPARPTVEGSFPAPETNSTGAGETPVGGLREVLNQTEGWRSYSFTWQTPTLEAETIYIAVGISAVWETEMTYFVDDVRLSATPA